ncbi:alpha/beta hydrolase [Bacillus safensis]|uniref:alpha/beta hydrolase n=1 Tax=Bacillus safensis TaxID=561879 RepID=UPI00227F03DC|nr:alpha/beta fold hydrolase [Bacillus safensis]MCY7675549.1 alpha/beta hydrolase [Bacillus safensis]MCY7697623.1 alpha/beta hydrolase [Bacillus safensis]MEC3625969.1 alpha/beta fold hydrolase [Bacillus safensis]
MTHTKTEPFSFTSMQQAAPVHIPERQFISSHDGTSLAYYPFLSEKKTQANVILIHGGGAHSLAGYEHIAYTLQHDFHVNVFLLDLRGHGHSQGKKGDTPRVTDVWQDISQVVDAIKQEHKGAIYLCGHSSGAGLLLNYLSWPKKREVDGYFFIAPEFGYKSGTARPDQIPFASVQVWKFVLSAMTKGGLMSHSEAVRFHYPEWVVEQDPLLLTAITVNLSLALTPSAPKNQFAKMDRPYGMFVGSKDELYDVETFLHYHEMPMEPIKKQSVYQVMEGHTHLSILLGAGKQIGSTIQMWNHSI